MPRFQVDFKRAGRDGRAPQPPALLRKRTLRGVNDVRDAMPGVSWRRERTRCAG
jgi:hypothetical protein